MNDPAQRTAYADRPLWRRALGPVLLLAGALGLVYLVALALDRPVDRRPLERKVQLKNLGSALKVYSNEYGAWPYSDRGPEAALYLLHEHAGKWPAPSLDVPGRSEPDGPARYDEATKRVIGSGYIYLNPPPTSGSWPDTDPACLAAEARLDTSGGLHTLWTDGHVEYLRPQPGMPLGELLGKTASDVKAMTLP